MNIVMAASEMTPFAKTGGLADVVAALPRELAAMGHEVVVFLPFYRAAREKAADARPVKGAVTVPLGDRYASGELYELRVAERLRVVFLRHDDYFDRPGFYGTESGEYADNAERFIFFSKCVVAGVGRLRFVPDVLHAHDWHAALAPLWWKRELGAAWRLKTVFTIHNLAYQGVFPWQTFGLTNLPGEFFALYGLEFHGQMNLMKAGLLYSDAVNAVSPRYAEEIRTKEFGCGLDGLLRDLGPRLHGILNGVDYDEWSPESDPHIAARYRADDLGGKAICKRALLKAFDLPAEREAAPLIGIVSRIAEQKGCDLVADALPQLVEMGATVVILGTGEKALEARLTAWAEQYPAEIGLHLGFSNPLAHQIEAGADMFLMPSRFEPCGLNQMYSLRYGTIPVVHAVGGLADTVQQYDPATGSGTGFRFNTPSADEMLAAVRAALALRGQPEHWRRIMQNAMACDYSWRRSAQRYLELYQQL